jgi:hypothetical protein
MTILAFGATFGYGPLLTAHALLGTLVLLSALAAVFVRWARRATLYGLGLQIVLGAVVSGVFKVPPQPLHVLLPVLAGGVYAMANAFERKGRPPALVRGMLLLGVAMIAATYYIGERGIH